MQTFLPYSDFLKSVKCLDYRRLGKQRVEGKQILNALHPNYKKAGWKNHPAVLMWKGFENSLKNYINICIYEWIKRGYKNSMIFYSIEGKIINPPWIGDKKFHLSHRMNLLRKDFNFYKNCFTKEVIEFNKKEIDEYEYVWPIRKDK